MMSVKQRAPPYIVFKIKAATVAAQKFTEAVDLCVAKLLLIDYHISYVLAIL